MEAITAITTFIVVFFIVFTVLSYINVRGLSKAEISPSPEAIPADDDQWANDNGFEYVGSYRIRVGITKATIWAWGRTDRPTYFCRYLFLVGNKPKIVHDLTTEFADDVSLTTVDSKDSNSQPLRPGSYTQNFIGISQDKSWTFHIEAENYLIDKGGANLHAKETGFEQSFIEAIRGQSNYIRTLPLWPLRGFYWYLIRRSIYPNKSIRVQHEKKMIRLPNELKSKDLPTIEI